MEGQTKTISLTIVRHGQTDANKNRVLRGHRRTNSPINCFGIKQAQAAGKKIISFLCMVKCDTFCLLTLVQLGSQVSASLR